MPFAALSKDWKPLNVSLETSHEKRSKRDDACVQRETVLNAWSKASSSTEHGPNDTIYEGDICADIRAISAKEEVDPETADRWKAVFLDRYALRWEVDCGNRDDLSHVPLEMIRLFNIRARVLHGWGETRTQILDICDNWIGHWRFDRINEITPKDYRRLCRLYYS